MRLEALKNFITVVECGTITEAARKICIAQPALSNQIRGLEEELGVPLFAKSGRGVALTRSGEEFLEHTERALQTLDEGVAAVRRSADDANRIRLGFIAPLGVEFVPRLAAGYQPDPPASHGRSGPPQRRDFAVRHWLPA